MGNIKEKDIIKVKVTGVQPYGAFVSCDDDYNGLIHISEVSYGYVKDINDFMNVGDDIYAEVINVDDKENHLKLSIKDINYKDDGSKLIRLAETKSGFEPLKKHLDLWIDDKIKEIMDKM